MGKHIQAVKATRVRWTILAILFIVTTINYADRATISIAGPELSKQLGLSPVQMGLVFSAFSWSYVLCQLPGGWLLDRFGTRIVYFFSIFLWSLFTLAQGWVGFFSGGAAVAMLFTLRLIVGAAEAPSFPGNSRLTTSWFPTAERGTAAAIFNSAQYFATVLFAPIMGWLVHSYGWESVFFMMGGLGIVIALAWLKFVHGPRQHPKANAAELQHLERGGALVDLETTGLLAADRPQVDTWSCLKQLLSSRMLLGIYIGQYCINTLTYFFLTWFPIYLVKERHMTILKAGFIAALPAVAGFLGGVLGGIISDRMIKRGYSTSVARKTPIIGGMLLATTMVLCNYVDQDWVVVAVMALAFFGKGIGALGWAVVGDTSPSQAGGMSGSLFNMFGNVAGITTPIVIGFILQATGSFYGALVFVGANALVTVLCYLFLVGEIKRFEFAKPVVKVAEAA
jgi:ACS family glucarate transporter-like MFS transporter